VRGSATESHDRTVRRFGREAHRPTGFAALGGDHEGYTSGMYRDVDVTTVRTASIFRVEQLSK
jgi:hypothetical protein